MSYVVIIIHGIGNLNNVKNVKKLISICRGCCFLIILLKCYLKENFVFFFFRADGSIEIWNIRDDWYQEIVSYCNHFNDKSFFF